MADDTPREPPADPALNIVADDDEGIDELDYESTTSSVRSSVFTPREQHGRLYHGYKDGSYHRPNDEAELDRLDISAALLMMINDNKPHLAPLISSPQRVLDIGAGTGIWCMDMGDAYPSAEIIGVDISASFPSMVPPNVTFEIDDIEDPWTFSRPFDFIHARYMVGSIKDWPQLMRHSFEFLQPGGWIELQDFDIEYYSQDASLTEDTALRRWISLCHEAAGKIGRSLREAKGFDKYLADAGFVNIQVRKTPVPIGTWPKDERLKKMGAYNWVQLYQALQAVSLRLFLNVLGWTREDLEMLLIEVRADLKDQKIHALYDVYSVWAQKPGTTRTPDLLDGSDSTPAAVESTPTEAPPATD